MHSLDGRLSPEKRIMTEVHVLYWTPWLIEAHLMEAADTLRRLPDRRAGGYFSTWPDIVRTCGLGKQRTWVGPPTGQAIDRMDRTFRWLRWLDPRDQRIAWERACRLPWKVIARRHHMNRTTAWRHWVAALLTIAAHLDARAEKVSMQRFSMQHFTANLVA
jgi:Domain of unknown function (DUF6362)